MLEIARNYIMLIMQFINGVYNWKIEWTPGYEIKIGTLVVGFTSFMLIIYYFLNAFGFIRKDDE